MHIYADTFYNTFQQNGGREKEQYRKDSINIQTLLMGFFQQKEGKGEGKKKEGRKTYLTIGLEKEFTCQRSQKFRSQFWVLPQLNSAGRQCYQELSLFCLSPLLPCVLTVSSTNNSERFPFKSYNFASHRL